MFGYKQLNEHRHIAWQMDRCLSAWQCFVLSNWYWSAHKLSADILWSFCAVNSALLPFNWSVQQFIMLCPPGWSEAAPSVSLQQAAGPAALRARGDIPSMFTHHWRSWSVCLSLWPQHKQLHPQINKTRGRGHKCSRTQSKRRWDNESGLPLFACVYVCVRASVYTSAFMCN